MSFSVNTFPPERTAQRATAGCTCVTVPGSDHVDHPGLQIIGNLLYFSPTAVTEWHCSAWISISAGLRLSQIAGEKRHFCAKRFSDSPIEHFPGSPIGSTLEKPSTQSCTLQSVLSAFHIFTYEEDLWMSALTYPLFCILFSSRSVLHSMQRQETP